MTAGRRTVTVYLEGVCQVCLHECWFVDAQRNREGQWVRGQWVHASEYGPAPHPATPLVRA